MSPFAKHSDIIWDKMQVLSHVNQHLQSFVYHLKRACVTIKAKKMPIMERGHLNLFGVWPFKRVQYNNKKQEKNEQWFAFKS